LSVRLALDLGRILLDSGNVKSNYLVLLIYSNCREGRGWHLTTYFAKTKKPGFCYKICNIRASKCVEALAQFDTIQPNFEVDQK